MNDVIKKVKKKGEWKVRESEREKGAPTSRAVTSTKSIKICQWLTCLTVSELSSNHNPTALLVFLHLFRQIKMCAFVLFNKYIAHSGKRKPVSPSTNSSSFISEAEISSLSCILATVKTLWSFLQSCQLCTLKIRLFAYVVFLFLNSSLYLISTSE